MKDFPNAGETAFELLAPLSGWVLPLSEVPDPVFAAGMAGWGVAIDPTSETLVAPCEGEVRLAGGNLHAVSLHCAAGELLLHVGIDTVNMAGQGFRLHVVHGERVRAGQPLLDFDLAAIARSASSAITPVLVSGTSAASFSGLTVGKKVQAGDFLMRLLGTSGVAPPEPSAAVASQDWRHYRVVVEHGLHARPAARLASALKGLEVDVVLRADGREASALSAVAVMAMGIKFGARISVHVSGRDVAAASTAFAGLFELEEPLQQSQPLQQSRPSQPSLEGLFVVPGGSVSGVVASIGWAEGVVVQVRATEPDTSNDSSPQLPAVEQQRLDAAIAAVRRRLLVLAEGQPSDAQELLAAHAELLADPGLLAGAARRISRGEAARSAWRAEVMSVADTLAHLNDARMAERRADLMDLDAQVGRALAGEVLDQVQDLPEGAIVIAQELLPSQLLALDHTRLAGVCMASGGASSHVAILAAARGLPMLVGVGAAVLTIAEGTRVLLDTDAGALLVDPTQVQRERHAERRSLSVARFAEDRAAALQPAVTLDGVEIEVWCNLGKAAEAAPAIAAGAGGCGLLRTEFLFLDRRTAPDVAEQLTEYQSIAAALGGRPLTIRTLDAGGDKPVAYLPQSREENPALGLRGLRTSLAHPELLATQLEAILQVEPAGQCRVLLPMVTEVGEVRAVRAVLDKLSVAAGKPAPALGVMIETPAAALLVEQLCREVDFLSIGTNDLAQYTLAMDRQHPTLAARLDSLHPAVLLLVARVATAAANSGTELGLCGGLASDPLAVPLLLGLGVSELSVAPAMVPTIKGRVRRLSLGQCRELAAEVLQLSDAMAVRARVRAWLGEE